MWSQLAPNLFLDQQREPICSKQRFTFSQKEWIHRRKPADKSQQPQLPLVLRTSFRVLHVTPGPSACFPGDHSKSMWVRSGTNQESLLFLKDLLPTHRAKASSGPRAPSFVSLGLGMFFAFFFLNLYYCVRVTACVVHRWRSVTFLLLFCGSWGLNSTGLCDEGEPFC